MQGQRAIKSSVTDHSRMNALARSIWSLGAGQATQAPSLMTTRGASGAASLRFSGTRERPAVIGRRALVGGPSDAAALRGGILGAVEAGRRCSSERAGRERAVTMSRADTRGCEASRMVRETDRLGGRERAGARAQSQERTDSHELVSTQALEA